MTRLSNVVIDNNGFNRRTIAGSFIQKAHVKAHTRKTKSGKLAQVKEYDDKRQKHEAGPAKKATAKDQVLEWLHDSGSVYAWEVTDQEGKILRQLLKEGKVVRKKDEKNGHVLFEPVKKDKIAPVMAGKQAQAKEASKSPVPGMKRFDEMDWSGYAGAEQFADGSDPLIGEFAVDDMEGVIIAGGEGIQIIVVSDDNEDDRDFVYDISLKTDKLTLMMAKNLMADKKLSAKELEEYGFEKIN